LSSSYGKRNAHRADQALQQPDHHTVLLAGVAGPQERRHQILFGLVVETEEAEQADSNEYP
jgi:hypothetical protein